MRRRVDRGVALLRQGFAPLLVLTGGKRRPARPREASVAARYAREIHGVQADLLLSEEESLNTEQNALYSARALRERGLQQPSVMVVSDQFHGHRCRLLFSRHFHRVEVVSAGNPGLARLAPALAREALALAWLRLTVARPARQ